MKLSYEQSRDLDLIIEELIKIGDVNSIENIKEKLFPNKSLEYCNSLFYKLKEHYPELLYPENNPEPNYFWAREYAESFLLDGGFSAIYDEKNIDSQKLILKEKLEIEKSKYELKNAKRIYKSYWWTFAFALIAFLISIINFLMQLLN